MDKADSLGLSSARVEEASAKHITLPQKGAASSTGHRRAFRTNVAGRVEPAVHPRRLHHAAAGLAARGARGGADTLGARRGTVRARFYSRLNVKVPDASEKCLGFLSGLLCYDPQIRSTASEALGSGWFEAAPRACPLQNMPQFPAGAGTHLKPAAPPRKQEGPKRRRY